MPPTNPPRPVGPAVPAPADVALPPVDHGPLRRIRVRRILQQAAEGAVTLFMFAPIYLITLARFSSRAEHNRFPKALWPRDLSMETLRGFLNSTGVIPAFLNSIVV